MAILAKSHWDNATSSSCYILDTIISQHQVASTATHYQYLLTYCMYNGWTLNLILLKEVISIHHFRKIKISFIKMVVEFYLS